MDRLSQAIYIIRNNTIIYMNHAACKLSGVPILEQNSETQQNADFSSYSEQVFASFRSIASQSNSLFSFYESRKNNPSESNAPMCFQYNDSNNVERKLEARIQKINFDSKEAIVCTIDDLTISLQLERQLLNKRFEKIFMSSFTHELVTPVNGILGVMDILQEKKELSLEVRKTIEAAKASCKLLLYMTNDVIELAREENEEKVSREWFSLKEVISECVQLYDFSFKKKRLTLLQNIAHDVPTLICTDRTRYRQIIVHLLGNALKYTMKGSVNISIQYISADNSLITSVSDTGIGISQSSIQNLFQLFGNFDNHCQLNPQGIGLSLTICKRYATIMGGKITVDSIRGKGSNFTFITPVKTTEITEHVDIDIPNDLAFDPDDDWIQTHFGFEASPRKGLEPKASDTPKTEINFFEDTVQQLKYKPVSCQCRKFLVVDDNELNRFVIQGLLKGLNYYGDEAFNGQQAIDSVLARYKNRCCHRYALIFMDINMPIMNGNEATQILHGMMEKHQIGRMPIVAVTAAHCQNEEEKEKYFELGFDDFGIFICCEL